MRRRDFIGLGAATLAMSACEPLARLRGLGIPLTVLRPGRAEGHRLREGGALPKATTELRAGVVILGGGIAGLTTAWRLAREGFEDFVLIDGPEPDGNAAAARFTAAGETYAAPRGAHYLPLPSRESMHVREILADLGVLRGDPRAERPEYDEAALVHAPEERVWFQGAWRDGLLPTAWVADAEAGQHRRFEALIERLRAARGADGRKAFAMPVALSSDDPAWRALDGINFADWLKREGYDAPSLRAYLDYACRDDYGAGLSGVSAWAGLHYFAARDGLAGNAEPGAVLTWPEGLRALARGLARRIPAQRRRAGHALRVESTRDGARVLCLGGDGAAFSLRARRVVCAMPLHVAARVVAGIEDYGFDPARHMPEHAPWLIGNVLLRGFPKEQAGVELAWDNVVHGSSGLGWVVSTHQDLRAARPAHTVFTTYRALAEHAPREGRAWLETASDADLLTLALEDLERAYNPVDLWRRMQSVELTLRGHAMAIPRPGYLANPGLAALRAADGPVLFAHSDLSGYSVFEEAAWWGEVAARRILDA
jgi:glycine/D-amino acid oxidase-like deaminating enzyme